MRVNVTKTISIYQCIRSIWLYENRVRIRRVINREMVYGCLDWSSRGCYRYWYKAGRRIGLDIPILVQNVCDEFGFTGKVYCIPIRLVSMLPVDILGMNDLDSSLLEVEEIVDRLNGLGV